MYFDDGHMSGWGFAFMGLGTLLFWALLIAGAILLFRTLRTGGFGGSGARTDRPDAERLLAERYARGEIDEEEYRRRLSVLRQG